MYKWKLWFHLICQIVNVIKLGYIEVFEYALRVVTDLILPTKNKDEMEKK